jgi:hypothetical protein
MKAGRAYPAGIERLTGRDLDSMLERGELSASVWYRRNTLIALTELAAQAKRSHDPMSRWRLKKFRAALDAMEGNDEIEVSGEILCETVVLAMTRIASR